MEHSFWGGGEGLMNLIEPYLPFKALSTFLMIIGLSLSQNLLGCIWYFACGDSPYI